MSQNRMVILGSSSGNPSPTRATSGYILEVDSRLSLIDCGGGVCSSFLRRGFDPLEIGPGYYQLQLRKKQFVLLRDDLENCIYGAINAGFIIFNSNINWNIYFQCVRTFYEVKILYRVINSVARVW